MHLPVAACSPRGCLESRELRRDGVREAREVRVLVADGSRLPRRTREAVHLQHDSGPLQGECALE